MPDNNKKGRIVSFEKGINQGTHPLQLKSGEVIDAYNMTSRARGILGQFSWPRPYEYATGSAYDRVNNGTSTPGVNLTFTNGSATVASSADISATITVGSNLRAVIDNFQFYRVTAVAAGGLSFTIDRAWPNPTQARAGGGDWTGWAVYYPVCALHRWTDTKANVQLAAVSKNLIRRWNTGTNSWDTEYTLGSHNQRGEFAHDPTGNAYYTNGADAPLTAKTGDGDWQNLVGPVIERDIVVGTLSYITHMIKTSAGTVLVAGCQETGIWLAQVWRSEDDGKTFTKVLERTTAAQSWMCTKLCETTNGAVVALVYRTGSNWAEIYRSTDDGENWSERYDGAADGVQHLEDVVEANDILFAVGHAGMVVTSGNDGKTWSLMANRCLTATEPRAIAAYNNGSYDRLAVIDGDGLIARTTNTSALTTSVAWADTDEFAATVSIFNTWYRPDGKAIFAGDNLGGGFCIVQGKKTGPAFFQHWKKYRALHKVRLHQAGPGFWENTHNSLFYCLGFENTNVSTGRLALAVSSDEGDKWEVVWKDNSGSFEKHPILGAVHIGENEFLVADYNNLHRLRYHVWASKAKRMMFWRSRLFIWGDMLDLASPLGAFPHAVTASTLTYYGKQYEPDELVGARLYPDPATYPTKYYMITGNTKYVMTVDGSDLSTYATTSTAFEVRWYVPNRIRWSELLNYRSWPEYNFLDEDTPIISVKKHLQGGVVTPQSGLHILCKASNSLLLGTGPDDWVNFPGGVERGSVAHFSLARDVVLSHDGLALISNGVPLPFASRVDSTTLQENGPQEFMSRLNQSYYQESIGWERKGRRYVAVPWAGSPWLNRIYELDMLAEGIFVMDIDRIARDGTTGTHYLPTCVHAEDDGSLVILGTMEGSLARFMAAEKGYGDEAGAVFSLVAGGPAVWAHFVRAYLDVYVEMEGTIQFRWRCDFNPWSPWKSIIPPLEAGKVAQVRMSFPQEAKGNFMALEVKIDNDGYKEFYAPLDFVYDELPRGI